MTTNRTRVRDIAFSHVGGVSSLTHHPECVCLWDGKKRRAEHVAKESARAFLITTYSHQARENCDGA